MIRGTEEAAQRVRAAIESGGLENLDAILTDVRACGAIQYTEDKAVEQSELAIQAIANLPESEYKSALVTLAQAAVNRRN